MKHLRENQHRHVAPHAITLLRDFQQLADHRLLCGRVTVVELQRVRPASKVRVASVRQDQLATLRLQPYVVRRRPRQLLLRAANVVVRVLLNPRVIQRGVVWNKIQHQLQATFPQPLPHPGQRGRPAETFVDRVPGNRKARAWNIRVSQIRQSILKFLSPFRIAPRDALPGLAGLPHAQKPNPIKTLAGEIIQIGVRDVIQRSRMAKFPGELSHPDARVYLIERRIHGRLHKSVLLLVFKR